KKQSRRREPDSHFDKGCRGKLRSNGVFLIAGHCSTPYRCNCLSVYTMRASSSSEEPKSRGGNDPKGASAASSPALVFSGGPRQLRFPQRSGSMSVTACQLLSGLNDVMRSARPTS